MKMLSAALAACLLGAPAYAAPLCDSFGFAGLLAKCNRGETIELTLSSGQPLGEDVTLQSGAYYEMEITSDGSGEMGLEGKDFFRNIWMDEIVINDIEIRPMAIDSFEFDAAGVMELSFVAIKPGQHVIRIRGTTGETQQVTITIQ
ncbi:hypothetical protein ACN2XU_13750 [Primorskyibacter sp. 2E107]|uniref:hypothetical protein n=1 Tax=Primorskyibacter sp. 2E107 TaxID=3403458 RepID=UPI003AF7D04C